jgi:hypothetical protein
MRLRIAGLTLVALLWAAPAFAQGCAMCYASATATTKGGREALSRGILVLLMPPVGFMTVGVGMAFRYGRKRDRELGSGFSGAESPDRDLDMARP